MRTFLVALFLILPSLASAQIPGAPFDYPGEDARFARSGIPVWGHAQATRLASDVCVKTATGAFSQANRCKLFDWGTRVTVQGCTQETTICVSQTATVTLSIGVDGGWIEDGSGEDGVSACSVVGPSPDREDLILDPVQFRDLTSVARKDGVCTTTLNSVVGSYPTVGWPCSASADCVYGGVVCDLDGIVENGRTYPSWTYTKGAFLLVQSAADGRCFFKVDR